MVRLQVGRIAGTTGVAALVVGAVGSVGATPLPLGDPPQLAPESVNVMMSSPTARLVEKLDFMAFTFDPKGSGSERDRIPICHGIRARDRLAIDKSPCSDEFRGGTATRKQAISFKGTSARMCLCRAFVVPTPVPLSERGSVVIPRRHPREGRMHDSAPTDISHTC